MRNRRQHLVGDVDLLAGVDHLGQQAGPAAEEVRLGARGLQRLDRHQADDRGALDVRLLPQQPVVELAGATVDQEERDEVDRSQADADQRQHGVEVEHQRAEEHDREHRQHSAGDQVRHDLGQLLVQSDPHRHVAGGPLGEEVHRQPQHVRDELAGHLQGQHRLQPGEVVPLHPGETGQQHGSDRQGDQQRRHDVRAMADQEVVDEHLGQGGHGEARDDQGQAGDHQVQQRRAHRAGPAAESADRAGRAAAGGEVRAWLEAHHHTGERSVELRGARVPAATFGVVQVGTGVVEAVDDQEVVEVPEGDQRERKLTESLGLLAEAAGDQSVRPGRFHDPRRVAAVPGDPARDPQLLQRHLTAVVGQHHRQRCGAALGRLHLQDGRGPHPTPGPAQLRAGFLRFREGVSHADRTASGRASPTPG